MGVRAQHEGRLLELLLLPAPLLLLLLFQMLPLLLLSLLSAFMRT